MRILQYSEQYFLWVALCYSFFEYELEYVCIYELLRG